MPDGTNFQVATAGATQARTTYLFVDIETRSAVNLLRQGVYVYAEHPSTAIILLSYAVDDGPIKTWVCVRADPMPDDLRAAVLDPQTIFIAHNASFERVLLTVVGRSFLSPDVYRALRTVERWSCTAARSALMGLPRSLENVGKALGLSIQKDLEGYNLMLVMCAPRALGVDGRKYVWMEDAASLKRLGDYCEVDVAVERLIHADLPMQSEFEHQLWCATERMNDRGISVDGPLLQKLIHFASDAEAMASHRMYTLTDGAVPKVTNTIALRKWLVSKGLDEAEELDERGKPKGVGKWMLQHWLEDDSLPSLLREVLVVRKEGGKSSTKKFVAIAHRLNLDDRIRGSLLYCGAASTSRFSSRGAQLQNLPRGVTVKDMPEAINDMMIGVSLTEIRRHGPPLVVASEMARPVFVAEPHHWLARGDYSQIEARVLAWIAGETWKVQAFRDYDIFLPGQFDAKGKPRRKGKDLYTLAAAPIFGKSMEDIDSNERQIGKVSELACGYQGGVRALQSMARLYNVKLSDADAEKIKQAWRITNSGIVQFWWDLDNGAVRCMRSKHGEKIEIRPGLWFKRNRRALALRVPAGGALIYWYPKLEEVDVPWGGKRLTVTFMAENSQKHVWVRHKGYGGLWCENVCQKVARDIMGDALIRMDEMQLGPRLTVHDEAVCSIPWTRARTESDAATLVRNVMMVGPPWARGLPIAADTSAAQRYLKS